MADSLATFNGHDQKPAQFHLKTREIYRLLRGVDVTQLQCGLTMDMATNGLSTMKTRNTLRWICGSILAAGTGVWTGLIIIQAGEIQGWLPILGIEAVGLCGSYWLLSSAINHQKKIKQLQKLENISLYQYKLPFSNGSSLSFGADLLSDRTQGSNTLGLGLRYNF